MPLLGTCEHRRAGRTPKVSTASARYFLFPAAGPGLNSSKSGNVQSR